MGKVIQAVVFCLFLGCVYGAPADTTGTQDVDSFQHKMKVEKTFYVEGQFLTETLEETDDGIIIDVEAEQGSTALTVFTDVTHGLLLHRFSTHDFCYISSLAEYNDTRSAQENPSSVFKYRLVPISEINRQYFSHTATRDMKHVCSGARNILWSEIHAEGEQETRQKRGCRGVCKMVCHIGRSCDYVCGMECDF
ncbi:uncharacterized protein LOC117101051 isoform X2 [Anneissia japonica]|uniref:uncharacterized protein LOC117101051 isoform X2 n=1 Tax=Anneissia japonica TaxID=1529436 RepID=UPI0014256055|nr:uncharacterized protein LOC117101051 isoform X2 [Anneissia japonica]